MILLSYDDITIFLQIPQYKHKHINKSSLMCQPLRQIYDKKSPIFIAQIGILISTIIIFQYPSTCFQHLHTFYLLIIIISSSQVFLKTIGLAIIHAINKQIANTVQTILVGVYIICHLGLWIYAILMLVNNRFKQSCRVEEPNYFYVNIYVHIYGVIIIGSAVLLVVLLVPVTVLTLFSFKKKKENNQD